MENNSIQFDELLKKVEEYVEVNVKLFKYKAIDKMSSMISAVIIYRIILKVLMLFSIFLSLGLASWLGDILGKIYYGIFIVSGVYLIIALVLYASREKIRQRICNSIISKAFN